MEINPTFSNVPMADAVKHFIDGIQSADPLSSDFDEDDLGVSWGHRQFQGWNAKLSSWDAIGSPENACCLVAAVIKTCRVARELCRDLEAKNLAKGYTTSYLSDMYLEQITERLWDLWKAAGGGEIHI
jgi:hypothetical protein